MVAKVNEDENASGLESSPLVPNKGGDRPAARQRRSSLRKSVMSSVRGSRALGYAMEGEEEEEPERTLTVMGAAMNMTTTSIGAGIVNLPQATWDGGFFGIVTLLPLCAIFSCISCLLLEKTMTAMLKADKSANVNAMENLAQNAMGKFGYILVRFISTCTLVSVGVLFIILAGTLFELIIPLNKRWFMVMFLGAMVPLAWLNDLSALAKVSIIGVGCSVLTMIAIACAGFIAFGDDHISRDGAPFFHRFLPSSIGDYVGAFVTYVFGMGAVLVCPSCYNQMADRKQFPKAIILSHVMIACIYLLVALPAFFGFASSLAAPSPSSIFNMMRSHEDNKVEWTGYLVAITTSLSVMISFPLVTNVVLRMVEGLFPKLGANKGVSMIWRTIYVVLVVGIAIVGCDSFTPVLDLIASAFLMPIFFLFPIIIYWCWKKKECGGFGAALKGRMAAFVIHVVMFLLAGFAGVKGTIGAFQGMFAVSNSISATPDQSGQAVWNSEKKSFQLDWENMGTTDAKNKDYRWGIEAYKWNVQKGVVASGDNLDEIVDSKDVTGPYTADDFFWSKWQVGLDMSYPTKAATKDDAEVVYDDVSKLKVDMRAMVRLPPSGADDARKKQAGKVYRITAVSADKKKFTLDIGDDKTADFAAGDVAPLFLSPVTQKLFELWNEKADDDKDKSDMQKVFGNIQVGRWGMEVANGWALAALTRFSEQLEAKPNRGSNIEIQFADLQQTFHLDKTDADIFEDVAVPVTTWKKFEVFIKSDYSGDLKLGGGKDLKYYQGWEVTAFKDKDGKDVEAFTAKDISDALKERKVELKLLPKVSREIIS